MGVITAYEACFVDVAGKPWVRRGDGALSQLRERPLEFMGIGMPCAWSRLEGAPGIAQIRRASDRGQGREVNEKRPQ